MVSPRASRLDRHEIFPGRCGPFDIPLIMEENNVPASLKHGLKRIFKSSQSLLGNFDDRVKSKKGRRSRGGGNPALLDLTGFPLPRE